MTFPGCLGRGPGVRALRAESIGRVSPFPRGSALLPQKAAGPRALPNSEFGMWNSEFFAFFFAIPHSALCIPHLNCPPVPWNQRRLMVSACKALAPGPGNRGKAIFRWWPLIFRFERLPVFQASGSAPEVMTQDFLSWKVYGDRRARVKKKYAAMILDCRSQILD